MSILRDRMKRLLCTFSPVVIMAICGGCHPDHWLARNDLKECDGGWKPVYDKSYVIGRTQIASIGDPIVLIEPVGECDNPTIHYAEFKSSFSLSGDFVGIKNLRVDLHVPAHKRVSVQKMAWFGKRWHYVVPADEDKDISVLVDETGNINSSVLILDTKTYYSFGYSKSQNAVLTPTNTKVDLLQKRVIDRNYTALWDMVYFELVYSGRNDTSLNLLYREYVVPSEISKWKGNREDLVRQAYFQNLVFPPDSKKIGFRNMKIDVLRADAQGMEYMITADGN